MEGEIEYMIEITNKMRVIYQWGMMILKHVIFLGLQQRRTGGFCMNEDKKYDFDDRETSNDLIIKGTNEKELDEQLKAIYGESEFNRLFGEAAQ